MAYTTIDNPGEYFNTVLYTGNKTDGGGGSDNITGVGFSPNWVWIKGRSAAKSHYFYDTVRGATKQLNPNNENDENTGSTSLTAFLSDGFTLGDEPENNDDGVTFVSWNWKETADIGFDIVSYTGNATARTISHSCGAVPTMIIAKRRSSDESWGVYHVARGANKFLRLQSTNHEPDDESSIWNNTTPTSSVFSVGTSGLCNQNGGTYIAYLFADIKGFSKMGIYIGNNSVNGPFTYLGFKPAFLLIKDSTSGQFWHIVDNKRDPFNDGDASQLSSNSNAAESTIRTDRGTLPIDLLSNGFKIRTDGSSCNGTGSFIYMAFAENPFVTSTGVPATAR